MTAQNTAAASVASQARYVVDASHSSASFGVRHMMITTVRGDFRRLEGSVLLDPRAPEDAKVSASIEVASIATGDDKRDEHLRSADFFDAEKHPTITFQSKRVRAMGEALELVGDLTIRGTTREVTLVVDDLTSEQVDPWGNRRIGASARGKIKRSDFGMVWNGVLEAGGVLVGDDVSIQIEVSLVKQG